LASPGSPLAAFIVLLLLGLKHTRAAPFFADAALRIHHSFFPGLYFSKFHFHLTVTVSIRFHGSSSISSFSSDTIFQVMNVRKIIESYEQERSPATSQSPLRTATFRSRPRTRPRTQPSDASLVAAKQRSLRTQRSSSLKIVKEERPVTIVLKVRLHFAVIWLSVDTVYRSV